MEKEIFMHTSPNRMPLAAELYALERRAREERARFIAAGIGSAARALKSVVERGLAALNAKVVRHA
ncbi:MAG TPA: hypothetical protein VG591_09715 [Burkholderiales bacterium]|jgi:hypothetical protein|nr:hypothetical protein [Burkholderiales bacterium]